MSSTGSKGFKPVTLVALLALCKSSSMRSQEGPPRRSILKLTGYILIGRTWLRVGMFSLAACSAATHTILDGIAFISCFVALMPTVIQTLLSVGSDFIQCLACGLPSCSKTFALVAWNAAKGLRVFSLKDMELYFIWLCRHPGVASAITEASQGPHQYGLIMHWLLCPQRAFCIKIRTCFCFVCRWQQSIADW